MSGTPVPNGPANLALSPASDSGVVGDGITNVVTPSVTGTADPGTTIVLYDGASSVGGGVADLSTGAWTISTAVLAEGAHSLSATSTNANGSSTSSAPLAVTIDTTAPIVAISPIAGDNKLNSAEAGAGFAISGTTAGAENGRTVTVTLVDSTSAVVGTYTATVTSNAWSANVGSVAARALADGSYTVQANVSDLAGNAATQASRALSVDETVPTVSSVATSGTGIDVSGNGDLKAGKTVLLTLGFSEAVTVTGTPTLTLSGGGTASYLSGSGTGSLVFSYTVGAGQNTADLAVTATSLAGGSILDAAGNPANLAAAVANPAGTLQIDTTAPTIAIATIAGDNTLNLAEAGAGFAITGTTTGLEDGQVATITLVNSSSAVVGTYSATVTGNAWSVSLTSPEATGLSNGSYTVRANVSDLAGNAATQASRALSVDETVPTVSSVATSGTGIDVSGNGDLKAGKTVLLTLGFSEAVTVTGTPTLTLSGGGTASYLSGSGTGSLVFSYTVAAGQNTADLAVTATSLAGGSILDAAGNPANLAGAVTNPAGTLQIDTTAPTIAIATIAGDNTLNLAEAGLGFAITGTTTGLDDGQVATITLVNSSNAVLGTYTATVTGNAWSVAVSSTLSASLANGNYTIRANVSDLAGNPAAQGATSLRVDQTPPSFTIASGIAGDNTVNAAEAAAGFTISGTTLGTENGQIVTLNILDSTSTVVDTITATVAGNAWSANVTPTQALALSDGNYTVRANLNDLAGNPAPQATRALHVDQTAPSISIDATLATDNIVNAAEAGAGFVVSGTTSGAENGQTVNLQFFDSANILRGIYTATVSNSAWSATISPAQLRTLVDGSYTIRASVSDVAGNPSLPASHAFVLDLTAPTIVVDTVGGDDLLNAAEVAAGFTISGTTGQVEDGQVATIELVNSAGTVVATYTPTVTSNAWSIAIPAAQATSLADGTYAVEAQVSDLAGNLSQIENHLLSVATALPSLTVAAVATDNRVNAAEAAVGFTINGTASGIADGQVVTVHLINAGNAIIGNYAATVLGGMWQADVPASVSDVIAVYTVTANATDLAGNPAAEVSQTISLDKVPPTIAWNTTAGDDDISPSEAAAGFTLSGTTSGAEDGQTVTIELEHGGQPSFSALTATVAGNAWSVDVTPDQASGLASGAYVAEASVADAAGNEAIPAYQLLEVGSGGAPVPPSVVLVSSSIPNDDLGIGRQVILSLHMSKATTVSGGSPELLLNSGGQASYLSGSGTSVLEFAYTVGAGENTTDLAVTGVNLGTSVVDDGAGTQADLSGAVANPDGTLQIDTTAPTVLAMAAAPATADLSVGAIVTFTLQMSEAVIVLPAGGVPALTLNSGGTASYAFGSGSDTLTFTYTISAGDNAADLAVTGTSFQTHVVDLAGNAADLSAAVTNPAGTLQVDTTPPSVSVALIAGDDTVNLAEAVAGFSISGAAAGAEDGQTVTATLLDSSGGVVVTYMTSVSSGAWSVEVPQAQAEALTNGQYTVQVAVADAAGNAAVPGIRAFTVDETPPVLTITSLGAGSNVLNIARAASGLAISGTTVGTENGQIVTIDLLDASATVVHSYTATVASNSWSVNLTPVQAQALADGNYTVRANVMDVAGNPAPQVVRTLRVDETRPLNSIGTIAGDGTINLAETASPVTIAGTTVGVEDGQVASIRIYDTAGVLVNSFSTAVTGNAWSVALSASQAHALADGTYNVTVNVSDSAGNAAVQATRALIVDQTAPTLAITAPLAGDNILNLAEASAGFAITGTTGGLEDGQVATITLVNSSNAVVGTYSATVTGNAWSVAIGSVAARALADGSYTVQANVSDLAGNPASQATRALTIDETVPTVSSVATSGTGIDANGNGDLKAGKTVLLTPGFSEAVTVTGTPTLTLSGGGTASYLSGSGTGSLVFSYTVGAGQNTADLAVTATSLAGGSILDAAGNPANLAAAVANPAGTLQIDTTAPTIAIATIAGDNTLNLAEAGAGFAITGTTTGLEDGQVATITLVNSSSAVVGTYSATVTGNAWSVAIGSVAARALADGSYTVRANVSDVAGNAAAQASRTLTVDETPPTIAISTIAGDNTVNLAEAGAGFAIGGTTVGAQNGQVATVTLVNGSSAVVGTYTATVTSNAWSANVGSVAARALADGSYTVQANVSDLAGNPASQASRALTIDETVPTVSSVATSGTGIDANGNGDLKAGKTVLLTLGFSEAVTVTGTPTLTLSGGGTASYLSGSGTGSLVFSYTVGAGQNTADLAVTATSLAGGSILDAAGNPANLAAAVANPAGTLQIDTTAPTIAIATIAGDNTLNLAEAGAGFAITGTTTGLEDGQVATITLVNSSSAVVGTYSATVTGNAWSVSLTSPEATGLSNGSYTVRANVSDLAGNAATQASRALTIDETVPTVSSVATSGTGIDANGNGDLKAGKTVLLTLGFSEAVTVTGTPTLTLSGGGTASYLSGSGTGSLVFSYTVGAGQNTADLAVTATSLAGGSILDAAGNPANLAAAVANPAGTLQIDTTAPTITIATIAGDNTLNLAEAGLGFAITGTTTGLEDGQVATITLVNSSSAVVGTYTATVSSNAWSANVGSVAARALSDGSYTVQANVSDLAGNPASQATRALSVDETVPTVSSLATSGTGIDANGNGDLKAGKTVLLTLGFSEAVTVTGTPTLSLSGGGTASYLSGSGTGSLVFSYTVSAGQNTADLAVTAISLTGGSILDAAGNPANLAAAVANPAGTLQIDTTAPTIAVATIAGDNTLNLAEAGEGFAITGTTSGLEDGQVATITLVNSSGAVLGTYTATVTGNAWSVAVPSTLSASLANGSYTVQANVSDLAGNPAIPAAHTLTIDKTTPTIAISTISGDNRVNLVEADAGFVISGTTDGIEDGQVATITLLDASNAVVGTYTAAVTGSTWSVSLDPAQAAALANGAYTIQADVADLAGNETALTTQALTVDQTTPTIAVATIAGDNTLNLAEAGAGFAISGTTTGLEDGQVATITLVNSSNVVVGTYTASVTGNAWSVAIGSVAARALADGSYTVRANVSDLAGNPATQATRALTIDETVPTVSSLPTSGTGIDASGNGDLKAGKTVLLTLGFSEAVTVTGTPTLSLSGGGTASYLSGSGTASLVFSYTVAAGQNTADLAVTATSLAGGSILEAAGNPANLAAAVTNPSGTLQIDTTAPTIAIGTIAGDNTLNLAEAGAGFAITGTTTGLEDGQVATITLVNSSNAVLGTYTGTVTGSVWSVTVPSSLSATLANGNYTVRADVSDLAGNPAAQASRAITLDETTPTITIATIAGDNTLNLAEADAGFAIGGTTTGVEDGQVATIILVDSSNAVVGTYTATVTDNAWSVNLTPVQAMALADGAYAVEADVADLAGNEAAQTTQALTVDQTAPTIGIATIAGDNTLNLAEAGAGFAISGTTGGLEGGQVAAITLVNSSNAVVGTYSATVTGNAWSVAIGSVAARALADGSYTVRANVSDLAGNSALQATRTLSVDETVPTVSFVATSGTGIDANGNGDLKAGKTVLLTLGFSEAVTVTGTPTLSLSGGGTASYLSGSGTGSLVFSYTVSAGQNTADLAVTATSLAGGSILDAAGNPANLAAAVTNPSGTLQIDTTAPTIAIATIAGDNTLNLAEAGAGFAITGTTTGLEDGQVATITLVNSSSAVVGTYTATVTGNTWSVSLTSPEATALANGSYTVRANVSDLAGNSALQATRTLTIDETPPDEPARPALAVISNSADPTDTVTNVTTPLITGLAEPGTQVRVSIDNTLIGTVSADPVTGAWSFTASLLEGLHYITVVSVDAAGNSSAPSSPLALTIDTTASAAPIALTLDPASDTGVLGDDLTSATTPVITGAGTAGDTVTLYDGETVIGTATVGEDGKWSVTSTTLAKGTHTLKAVDTDPAGNVSEPSSPLALTNDTRAPAAPDALSLAASSNSGIPGDNLTNKVTPVITGTGNAGDTVTLYDGETVIGIAIVGEDGTWSVRSSKLSNGVHPLKAFDTDPAGNLSGPSTPLSLTIDITTPLVAGVTMSPNGGTLALGQSVSFTLAMSKAVMVTGGVPTLTLSNGAAATYDAANSTRDALLFDYVVAAGGDTTSLSISAVKMNGAVATDAAGNPADLSGAVGASTSTVVTTNGFHPFAALVASNGNPAEIVTVAAAVQPNIPGTYTHLGIGSIGADGVPYNVTGTISQVNAALAAVLLSPATGAPTMTGLITSISDADQSASSQLTNFSSMGSDLRAATTNSVVKAGTGSDTLTASNAGNTLIGGPGNDVLIGSALGTTMFGGTGSSTFFSLGGNTVIVGGGPQDIIVATKGDVLAATAKGGASLVALSENSSTLFSGGNDTIIGGGGSAIVQATGDSTLFFQGSGSSVFLGGNGNSTVTAGTGGGSFIFGGNGGGLFAGGLGGNNVIIGGEKSSTIFGGGNGDVLYSVGSAGTVIAAGAGNETLQGGYSSGNDVFFGGPGEDLVGLGSGSDVFFAGTGSSTVVAGVGPDVLAFVNGKSGGSETIVGFKMGTDHLSLQGYGSGANQAALQSATTTQGTASAPASTTLTLSDSTKIIFAGVSSVDQRVFG